MACEIMPEHVFVKTGPERPAAARRLTDRRQGLVLSLPVGSQPAARPGRFTGMLGRLSG